MNQYFVRNMCWCIFLWLVNFEYVLSYHLYINLRRSRDGTFVHSFLRPDVRTEFLCSYGRPSDLFSSLWAAFMLTVHINALYNLSVHGKEEHATWINTIPLKISHLFGFSVSNRWSQRESLACLRLDSHYSISLFDSNHFICDTSLQFCLHGNSFPLCACSISTDSTIIVYFSDCLDRPATARERMSSVVRF